MTEPTKPFFAPQLIISHGVTDISFYKKAFNAIELRSWKNDDTTYHVAELSIQGSIFQIHEEKPEASQFSPEKIHGTTTLIGLFTDDVDLLMKNAIEAGATLVSEAQDYDYGYRQGKIKDPFGHCWMIESKI